MKTFRLFFQCLLAAIILNSAGCATTSTTAKTADNTILSEPAKPWDDLSPVEKAESTLWYPFQYALYFGGSALGGR